LILSAEDVPWIVSPRFVPLMVLANATEASARNTAVTITTR
jgi:hypothetical protein